MSSPTDRLLPKDLLIICIAFSVPFLAGLLLYALSLAILLKYAIVGILAACFALVLFACPKLGVLFGIFYIYAGLAFYFTFHLAYPVVTVVTLALVLLLLQGESLRLRNPYFNWSVIFFSVFALQSMLFSYSLSYSLLSIFTFAKVVLFTFLIVQFIRTYRDLEICVAVIFIGAVLSVLLGVINLRLGIEKDFNVIGGVNLLRFTGTFENPNGLAISLVSVMPLAVYLIKRGGSIFLRLLSVLGLCIIVIGAFATFSRAAIFPVFFIILLVLVKEIGRNKGVFILVTAVVATLSILLIPSFYWRRLLSLGDFATLSQTDWSLYLRLKAIRVALDMFAAHPFTGIGLRNFIVRSGYELFVQIRVHNLFLEILVGVGLFGFAALMMVYYSCIRECIRGMRARLSEQMRMGDLSFYLLTSFLSTMVASFFTSEAFNYSIWIPLAGGLVLGNIIRDHDSELAQ